jgi:hypothetical protein
MFNDNEAFLQANKHHLEMVIKERPADAPSVYSFKRLLKQIDEELAELAANPQPARVGVPGSEGAMNEVLQKLDEQAGMIAAQAAEVKTLREASASTALGKPKRVLAKRVATKAPEAVVGAGRKRVKAAKNVGGKAAIAEKA